MDWWLIEYDFPNEQHVMLQVMDEFKTAHLSAGAPKDAALFSSGFPSDGKMKLFLSPASGAFASEIIRKYNGKRTGKPPQNSSLLIGLQTAFSLLQ